MTLDEYLFALRDHEECLGMFRKSEYSKDEESQAKECGLPCIRIENSDWRVENQFPCFTVWRRNIEVLIFFDGGTCSPDRRITTRLFKKLLCAKDYVPNLRFSGTATEPSTDNSLKENVLFGRVGFYELLCKKV